MTDIKELTEDQLEQVTGGKLLYLSKGTYSITCPFANCGYTYVRTVFPPEANDTGDVQVKTTTPFGKCECGADIYLESTSKAIYKYGINSGEAVVTHNADM